MKLVALGLLILVASTPAAATSGRIACDVQATALADFESRLDRGGSATEVLREWCAEHRLADPPAIRAQQDLTLHKPTPPEVRSLLRAAPDEAIRYRHVKLACGRRVLSEADNWYRPDALTAEMNRQLDDSDTPFGAVVRPLGFHRRTLSIEQAPEAGVLVRYRAVLLDASERPFSLVTESYLAALLDVSPETPDRASACSP